MHFAAPYNFDTLDVIRRDLAEIEFATLRQVVDLDTVNYHEDLVGLCAPNPDLGDGPMRALLVHRKTWNLS